MREKTATKRLELSECETDEFTRFNNLLRDVLKVPKKEIQERGKKATKSVPKNGRAKAK
jgi:hypothetical protein